MSSNASELGGKAEAHMTVIARTQIVLRQNQTPVVIGVALLLGISFGVLSATHAKAAVPIAAVIVAIASLLLIAALDVAVGLVVLLIISTLIDRFTLPIGGLSIRAEQLAAIGVLGGLAFVHRKNPSKAWLRPTVAEALLLAWLCVALMSSLFVAPERTASLKLVALVGICSSAMFLPRRLMRTELVETAIRWLLVALLLEAAYGLAAWLLHAGGGNISVSLNRGHLSAYGTLWEPNVFGAVCAAGAIAWLLIGHRFYRYSWAAVAICVGASTVSFTRTAWIAAAVVAGVMLITPLRHSVDVSVAAVAGLASVALIGAILVVDHIGDYWPVSAAAPQTAPTADVTSSVADPVDIVGRTRQISPVLSDLSSHPLFGGGLNSLGQRHTDPGLAHIGNLELLLLNDTGPVGVVLFALFALTVLVGAWRRRADALVVAVAAMTIVLGITNQATETTELMFTWLFLGLVLAATEPRSGVVTRPGTGRTDLDVGAWPIRRNAA